MPQSNRRQVLLVSRAVILNEHGELLLVRRAENDTRNPDLWEVPGGKVEYGQSVAEALDSEVSEETGLLIKRVSPLSYVDSHIIPDGKYQGLTYVAIFGIAQAIGGHIQLSREHYDHTWETHAHAMEYDLTVESRDALTALSELIIRKSTVRHTD